MGEGESRGRGLAALYAATRARTEALAAPLSPEDQQLQSMPDASPTKWHRAHTTWFFETFLLAPRGVPAYDPHYGYLWNSYYDGVGARHPRAARGVLSRPSADEVTGYRRAIDARVHELLVSEPDDVALAELTRLGIAHEEQHQELILTDILHAFAANPTEPVYAKPPSPSPPARPASVEMVRAPRFVEYAGGLVEIGANAKSPSDDASFVFDNEGPRHKVWLEPFALADRLVTVRDVRAFIRDGGYRSPSLWLSEGYAWVTSHGVRAPLYARVEDDAFRQFTLHGLRRMEDDEPASHLSFYEADAIARYLGARLPTEAEWETAAARTPVRGQFVEEGTYHPIANTDLYGGVWQWTRSSYSPYPRYVPPLGTIGEYNGKFMAGQIVLRGGSCLSPARHIRASYRNFWPPDTCFQMTGLRLARDV